MKYRLSIRVIAVDPAQDRLTEQLFARYAEARRVYRRTLLTLYRRRGLRKWEICLNYAGSPPWIDPISSESEDRERD